MPSRLSVALKWLVVSAAILVLIGWLIITPPGLFGKADAIGYAVCHRIDARSFHLGERQLPLCVRCSGMYLGATLGLIFQSVIGRRRGGAPHWKVILPLGLLAIAFGVDGANSYLYLIKETYPGAISLPNLYMPNHILRLLTGSGMGLGIAVALFPAFNQTVWADCQDLPALTGLKSLGILLALTLVLDLAMLTENPILLFPLALISAAGVLVLLTMIYSMVWAMIMRLENRFTSLAQMWLTLTAGFTLALLQIALIDLLRFWLTGTWGGFPLR